MKVLKFKTNIDCDECVKEVSQVLDSENSISRWNIDTERPDHLLSVSGQEVDPQAIKDLIEKAGYKAELERAIGIGGEDI